HKATSRPRFAETKQMTSYHFFNKHKNYVHFSIELYCIFVVFPRYFLVILTLFHAIFTSGFFFQKIHISLFLNLRETTL
ncbi:MAG: hypothetical protein LUE14_06240, partial [Clostridiales bacterium]|nr:hypothetical protein [Clostridiales bacterium]